MIEADPQLAQSFRDNSRGENYGAIQWDHIVDQYEDCFLSTENQTEKEIIPTTHNKFLFVSQSNEQITRQ
jgi:hypothetical protein